MDLAAFGTRPSLAVGMELDEGARLVVVSDDSHIRCGLSEVLRAQGYSVSAPADPAQAWLSMDDNSDAVLVELGPRALDVVQRGRQVAPHAIFMVMSAPGVGSSLLDVLRVGAEHHVLLPVDADALLALLVSAVERAAQHRELTRLKARGRSEHPNRRILGQHPLIQQLLSVVRQVAPSRASVLITGETGTGKELVARALHDCSGRSGPFVALSCAALAESVLESELFGHERGAFTGAVQRRDGRFKQADAGTLFLDEVSEVPAGTQLKLLRFLQEREYERVGSNRTERVDVRVVAATNRPLEDLVDAGKFRRDLFYRLNVVELAVPPLRSRLSDLPALALHCIEQACRENDRQREPQLSQAALDKLLDYSWPGNVRELRNVMERATVLCAGEEIDVQHLPRTLLDAVPSEVSRELAYALLPELTSNVPSPDMIPLTGMTMADVEKVMILRTLEAVNWSPARAASMLGISTRTVQYRLKQWGIDREQHCRRELDGPVSSRPTLRPRVNH